MDPTCPTCGYDQSGLIATWESSCPLTGTCTECGSDLDFVDMLHTKPIRFWWYAEHARGAISFVWRTFATMAMLADPGRFWKRWDRRQVRGSKRFVGFLVLASFILHTLASILGRAAAFEEYGGVHWWNRASAHDLSWVPDMLLDALNGILYPYANYYSWSVHSSSGWSPFNLSEVFITTPIFVAVPVAWIALCLIAPGVRRCVLERRWILVRAIGLSVLPTVVAHEFVRFMLAFISLYSHRTDPYVVWIGVPMVVLILFVWANALWAHMVSRAIRVPNPLWFNLGAIGFSTALALAGTVAYLRVFT
jgi:hypothetical protein